VGEFVVMDAQVLAVRNLTYRMFVEGGRAPTIEEVAHDADLTSAEVEASWRELHRAHALVLISTSLEIRMANPFSAVPTAFRVHAAGRWWYANCAWDALGICAALRVDGHIETSCPDCGARIALEVRDHRIDDERPCFIAWSPPRTGGTTSSSPEAR
jgi:alkylmercury lyase-like protein